jgi:hypothetical protein
MWPFRPERLTDVMPPADVRHILGLGRLVGSAVTLVEARAGGYGSIDAAEGETHADPFCTFFRHGRVGAEPAFQGADAACARCEQAFARRVLSPANPGSPGAPGGGPAGPNDQPLRLRCHMGLTDFLVPVRVSGKTVAGLIAGRRVESDEDRQRIRKSAGKIGKLTRAEAESAASSDRILVEPHDERVRERLIEEIARIPLRSPELEHRLAELAEFLGRLATREFDGERIRREDAVIEKIDTPPGEEIENFADLRHDIARILDALREDLALEHLAFFARSPKELDDLEAPASLLAESGLGGGSERRLLELDWSRLPAEKPGLRSAVARGLETVSATIGALVPAKDAPAGLKDRLTKSIFFPPVEMGTRFRAALAFGHASSKVPPDDRDYFFLARVARAVSRRYYALAAEIERRWLAERLRSTEKGKRDAEVARREAETAKKALAKTVGFTFFDARKLVDQCLERVRARAAERGVELDAKALLARLHVRADRPALARAFDDLLAAGLERTGHDQAGKPSPLRIFLKRTRDRLLFGVEAVGPFLDGRERRALFVRDGDGREGTGGGSDGKPAAGSGERPRFERAVEVLKRHDGALRVESERLHRDPADAGRWIGKTTFLADLPLPRREEPREGVPREVDRQSGAAPEARPDPLPPEAAVSRPAVEAPAPAVVDEGVAGLPEGA